MQPLLFHDSLSPFSLACNWTPLIYMHEGCVILREVLWTKNKKNEGDGPWARMQDTQEYLARATRIAALHLWSK